MEQELHQNEGKTKKERGGGVSGIGEGHRAVSGPGRSQRLSWGQVSQRKNQTKRGALPGVRSHILRGVVEGKKYEREVPGE